MRSHHTRRMVSCEECQDKFEHYSGQIRTTKRFCNDCLRSRSKNKKEKVV